MNTHGIQSARYATASTAIDAPVIVTRDSGAIENRRANDDIEGGGMLAFLASGGKIDPYVSTPGVPGTGATMPSISDRQFFQALASEPYNLITPQEALDAVKTGEIPNVMQAVIDGLPADQQFATTMLLAGATSFERNNPLVNVFGASQGMDAAAIDAFWSFAGGL